MANTLATEGRACVDGEIVEHDVGVDFFRLICGRKAGFHHFLEGSHIGVRTCQDDAVTWIDTMIAARDVDVDATTNDAHDVGTCDVADVQVFQCPSSED